MKKAGFGSRFFCLFGVAGAGVSCDAHGEGVDALGEALELSFEADQEVAREGDGKAEVRDDVHDVFHDSPFFSRKGRVGCTRLFYFLNTMLRLGALIEFLGVRCLRGRLR